MSNPRRKRSRARNRSHRRSRNPLFTSRKRHSFRRHHRSRNPGVAGFNTTDLIKLAGGAAVGVVGSKYISQLVLGGNNSGPMGAVAQAAATLALAYVGNKFGGGKVAEGIVAGGLGAIVQSLLTQYVGVPGAPMSGLGDPLGRALLGDYQPGTIATPSLFAAPMVAQPGGGQSSGRRRG